MTTKRVLNSQKENNDFGEIGNEPKVKFRLSDVLETIHHSSKHLNDQRKKSYKKPTQVDRARRTKVRRELNLRNSAK